MAAIKQSSNCMSLHRRHRQIVEMTFTVPNTKNAKPFSQREFRKLTANSHADRSTTSVQKMHVWPLTSFDAFLIF